MNTVEKDRLKKEAEMQINALKKINAWKKLAIAVSTFGVAAAYAGIHGTEHSLFLGISGILLIIAGFLAASVMNLGIKNGRRNVEKMINVLEESRIS